MRTIVCRRKLGKGEVYLFTQYFMMPCSLDRLTATSRHFLEHIFSRYRIVEMTGDPIQHLVALTGDGCLITLMNNSGKPWQGLVRLPATKWCFEKPRVFEQWRREGVAAVKDAFGVVFEGSVPPYEFSIYRISGANRTPAGDCKI